MLQLHSQGSLARRSGLHQRGIRPSLRLSTWEGMFAEVFAACTSGIVLTAWGLHLRGGPALVGLLGALPFVAQLLQLPAAALTARFGGKRVAMACALLGRQSFWPLVFLPFLDLSASTQTATVVLIAATASLLQVVCANGWMTWMGDLVPRGIGGRYFGRRSAWILLAGAVGNLIAGFVLDAAKARGVVPLALSGLSLMAVTSGAVTVLLLRKQQTSAHLAARASFAAGIRGALTDPHVLRLLRFLLLWSLAIGPAIPFWGLFMLEDLHLSFTWLALHQLAATLVRFVCAPRWGRAIDRFGSRPILIFCSFATSAIPLLWLIPRPDRLWPIMLDALVSGALWSGHGMATFQLPLALSRRELRPYVLGILSMTAGLATATSGVLGGVLASRLPPRVEVAGFPLVRLQLIFVLTGVLRLATSAFALTVSEPRSSRLRDVLRITLGLRPAPAPSPASTSEPAAGT